LLLVPSFDKAVRALDITAEGADLWPSTGGLGDHWFWAQPLIVGDTVYAPTVAGTVHAFNIRDGSEVWQFQQDKAEIRARPSLVSGVLLVASTDGHLYGLEPSTGDLIWATLQDDRSFLADPLVLESDGTVLYSDKNGSLSRVTAATGSLEMLFKPD
jgi:outer membrane protein assembly factor BamB